MTHAEYKSHIEEFGSTSNRKSPLSKFSDHFFNAKKRGIAFNINFKDWWDIWQKSGHWHERGQLALNYCMSRKNDTGGYEVGNVSITTNSENCSKGIEWNPHMERGCNTVKPLDEVKGYVSSKRKEGLVYLSAWKRKHLGTFKTAEEARAAYIKARSADYPEAPSC